MKIDRKNCFRSITVQMILLITLLLLPVNILIILETRKASDAIVEQTRMSVKSIVDVRIAELDDQMKKSYYLLYVMKTENADGITMWKQEGEEMDLVKRYVEVAALRYPGRIEAEYEVSPRLDVVRVLSLLIHNFVENIVKHALNPEDVTDILLRGSYENKTVTIEISDDGVGMEPD